MSPFSNVLKNFIVFDTFLPSSLGGRKGPSALWTLYIPSFWKQSTVPVPLKATLELASFAPAYVNVSSFACCLFLIRWQ